MSLSEVTVELRKILSIDEIKDAEDTKYETIPVPEWGGAIRIGTLDAGTLLEHAKAGDDPGRKYTAGLQMIVESLVDENGKRIGKPEHIAVFKKKNPVVTNRVSEEILKLNGWNKPTLDFAAKFKEAGTDPIKLKAISQQMAETAMRISEAGTDPEKLKAISEGKEETDAKNSSGETRMSVSPSV